MQHDLALALGRTVGEIRAMPNAEYVRWIAYVEKNGPLNPSLRMEAAVARLAALWAKDAKPADFMPWPRQPDVEATPQMLMAVLTAGSVPKKEA